MFLIKNVGIILILFVSLFSSCLEDNVSEDDCVPLSESETLTYRSCTVDLDCIYTTNGCCDCANGGQNIAVNIDRLSEFRALFDGKMTACTEMAMDPPCGSGTVSCNNGVCEYTE